MIRVSAPASKNAYGNTWQKVVMKFDSRLEIQEKYCCPFFMESEGSRNIYTVPI